MKWKREPSYGKIMLLALNWNLCFISSSSCSCCCCCRNPIGITVWFQFGKLSTNFRTIAAKSERTSNRNDQTQHSDAHCEIRSINGTCNLPRPTPRALPRAAAAVALLRLNDILSHFISRRQYGHGLGNGLGNGMVTGCGNVMGNARRHGKNWEQGRRIQFHFTIRRTSFAKFASATRFRRFRVRVGFNENSSTISFVTFCQGFINDLTEYCNQTQPKLARPGPARPGPAMPNQSRAGQKQRAMRSRGAREKQTTRHAMLTAI